MFIMDTDNYRVLKWQAGEPLGYVVAGGRGAGSTYDRLGTCYALFVDNQYNVYVSDNSNRVTIWRVTNSSYSQLVRRILKKCNKCHAFLRLHQVAGGNGAGNTNDKLNSPWGIYVDSSQGLYIVDRANHRVQFWAAGEIKEKKKETDFRH